MKKPVIKNEKLQVFFSRGAMVWIAVAIIAVFCFAAIFAGNLSPYDPNQNELRDMLQAPSAQHLLGTDAYGRDVFTRLLYGTRVSVVASVSSCAFAAVVGMLLGLLAGYYQKWVSRAILLESTISYLNLGIQQPNASWGNMVSDGQKYLMTHPLLCIVPGVCVMLLTIAFNILGDSVADAFDPKLRGKL